MRHDYVYFDTVCTLHNLCDNMSVLTGLFKLTTYVHVVGMENAGLSDMLNEGGFGGGLWGKPLRKLFPQHVL